MNFYLNSNVRKKEFQIMVQPTSQFVVDDVVPVSFNIYTKPKYFQDFMEEEKTKKIITKENFATIVSDYMEIHNDHEKRLEQKKLVFVEGDEFSIDTFYINDNYITVETIVECCKHYADMKNTKEFTVRLNENLLLYKNANFFNLDKINNNKDNESIEDYINEKIENQIEPQDAVVLFILDKWIKQEKKKYPKKKKSIEEYFVPSDKEGYFSFDNSENEEITKKVIEDLKIEDFLNELYGGMKGKCIMELYNENPYIRWKW